MVAFEPISAISSATDAMASGAHVDQRDVGAVSGQVQGDATADAAARAGHQGDRVEQWSFDASRHGLFPFRTFPLGAYLEGSTRTFILVPAWSASKPSSMTSSIGIGGHPTRGVVHAAGHQVDHRGEVGSRVAQRALDAGFVHHQVEQWCGQWLFVDRDADHRPSGADTGQRRLDGGLHARRVVHRVGSPAAGVVGDEGGHVDARRVQGPRPQRLDGGAPRRRRLDDEDVLDALAAQRKPQPDADRARAEHHRGAVGVRFAEGRRVVRHRHRLDQRAEFERHVVGQAVQHVGRDDGVLGHAAVGHQPVEADLRADVVVARLARRAAPAAVQRHDGHPVALGVVGDAVADVGDDAGELVAHRQRHLLTGQRVRFGRHEDRPRVVLVQVGAADAVEADLHLDGACGRVGFGHVSDFELVRSVVDSCFHAAMSM